MRFFTKRHVCLRTAWVGCLVASGAMATAATTCPLELVGTWRLSDTVGSGAPLLNFTPDGWANVLNAPGEGNPGDIAAQVH
jgi:hypothetical protein